MEHGNDFQFDQTVDRARRLGDIMCHIKQNGLASRIRPQEIKSHIQHMIHAGDLEMFQWKTAKSVLISSLYHLSCIFPHDFTPEYCRDIVEQIQ
jgi:hypothetical protein